MSKISNISVTWAGESVQDISFRFLDAADPREEFSIGEFRPDSFIRVLLSELFARIADVDQVSHNLELHLRGEGT